MKKPVVLTIIDGLGFADAREGNAWRLANTPVLNDLLANYPNSVVKAAGKEVGLPEGQIGNSEVGHLNIGAGEIVYTGLALIRKSLDDGSFKENGAFLKSIAHAKQNGGTVQVMGLLSPGGVHSLEEHAFAIIDMLNANGVKDATFHAFTDGRDVAPQSVKPSLERIVAKLNQYGYKLGSIQGRLYAMDRDEMFDKTEKAYETIKGHADTKFANALDYLNAEYAKGLNDEFLTPAVNSDSSVKFLKSGDSIIFFNFRPDRARQLSHLFVGSELYKHSPKNPVSNIQLTTMMGYEGIKSDVAFDSMLVKNPIGKVLSENNLTQLRIAETQKYAHVTFFMDGGKDIQIKGADRILIPSAKIDNFAEKPEMSAREITDALLPVLHKYDVVIMNYANPDMVGHTGDLKAAIQAVEVVDHELARLKAKVDELGGTMFITADHGNCEIMIEDGKPATKHTTNDVPFISTDKSIKLENGSLANIAPTILDYLGVAKPSSMDHKSLIKK